MATLMSLYRTRRETLDNETYKKIVNVFNLCGIDEFFDELEQIREVESGFFEMNLSRNPPPAIVSSDAVLTPEKEIFMWSPATGDTPATITVAGRMSPSEDSQYVFGGADSGIMYCIYSHESTYGQHTLQIPVSSKMPKIYCFAEHAGDRLSIVRLGEPDIRITIEKGRLILI